MRLLRGSTWGFGMNKRSLAAGAHLLAVAVLALAACSGLEPEPAQDTTVTPNLVPSLEEELPEKIAANRLVRSDIVINRADFDSMEDAALAWLDRYGNCLLHGKVFILEQNRVELIADGPGVLDFEVFANYVAEQLELAENQEVCIDALFDTSDPSAQPLIDLAGQANRVVVAYLMLGDSVDIAFEGLAFEEVADERIVGSVTRSLLFSTDPPQEVDRLVELKLAVNADGEVQWSSR